MNLKKAKALRMIVRQMVKKDIIKGDPWSVRGYIEHKKKVPVTKTADDGTEVTVEEEKVFAVTHGIMPNCPRGVYRRMKKYGLEKVLTGKA